MPDYRSKLKPHLWPALLLVAVAIAIYASSLDHEILTNWDDEKYITTNEAVRGFTPGHLKSAFTSFYMGNYAPLHIVSYMLDYSLWGMKAAGFIVSNILLHALNGLLYYYLLIRITGRRLWAFLAAFIFLSHPVQVESVAWISQRKNVLAMFFFLVSFLLYIRYQEQGSGNRDPENNKPEAGSGTQNSKLKTRNLFYAGSIAVFVCALLAKSVAVILPPLLLLYDLCFVAKSERQKWLVDKVPYIAAAVAVAVVALISQSPEFRGGKTSWHGGTPLATLLTMLPVCVRYLGLLFWPANLSAVYDPPIKTGIDLVVVLSAVVVALFCVGGFLLYRRRKELLFWWALFFVGLLPVSQIVPLVTLMNDRYLYFPMLGAAALVAGALVSGLDALSGFSRKAAATAVCLLLLTLPLLSFNRSKVWDNSLTLWTDALGKAPNSTLTNFSLGEIYHRAGKHDVALSLYLRALSRDPLNREALNNISVLYMDLGKIDNARPYLLKLVNKYPDLPEGLLTLGYYHFLKGNLVEAEDSFRDALKLRPDSGEAFKFLGNVLLEQRRLEPARNAYLEAIRNGSDSAEVRYSLSYLEAVTGRTGESLQYLSNALNLGYDNPAVIAGHPLRDLPEFQNMLTRHQMR